MHQEILVQQVRLLFPHEKTLVNTKQFGADPVFELDVWIPAHDLGFEFQDAYHYVHTWYSQKSLNSIQRTDNIKKLVVQQKGVTLIEVPCWWDGCVESLAGSINFQRPDVTASCASPIPLNPTVGLFKESEVPIIGELMRASFPVNNIISTAPNTWWLGEKYDGIRFCWSSSTRQVYTRSGSEVSLPPKFITCLPKLVLEGEFWFGRGDFSHAAALIQNVPELVMWHLLRLIAFDTPLRILHSCSFEDRYKLLLAVIVRNHAFSIVTHRVMTQSDIHLEWQVKQIIADGGEGVILRKVGSRYEPGRTSSLYKLKTPYGDTEAIVVGYGDQHSVQLRLPGGTIFTVPPRHVLTPSLPAIGDVVTFSYEMHVRTEVPASPKITRVRTDVSWKDVVANSVDETRFFNQQIRGSASMGRTNEEKPNKLSTKADSAPSVWNSVENRRRFFEDYAKANGFDPRLPGHWYNLTKVDFLTEKGAKQVLQYHKRSLRNALLDLFPDIGLDRTKLTPSWQDPSTRRKFFEDIAHLNGFDPLKAENWYQQLSSLVNSIKGGHRVVRYHQSLPKAIADLFPEIGFDESRVVPMWGELKNRRRFFEEYAREERFDPLVSSNWYLQPRDFIMSFKGAEQVMSYHKYRVSNALLACFPDIGLDTSKLQWHTRSSKRRH